MAINDFKVSNLVNIGMRQNILIHTPVVQQCEFPRVDAKLVHSGLPDFADIDSFRFVINPNQQTEQPVVLWCLANQKTLIEQSTGLVALGSVFVLNDNPIQMQADESTVVYCHNSRRTKKASFLDVCAGGFGGWTTAAEMLKHHNKLPIEKLIGVDIDQAAMQQWCLNHKAAYFETSSCIPWPTTKQIDCNLGIVADIQESGWRQSVFVHDPNIWAISAPCISWSGAGEESGFYSQGGLTLLTSLGLARLARPRALLIEQVRNFENHQHYPLFHKLIVWAGYKLVFSKVIEASDILPMKRPRWIGVALDVLSDHNYDMSLFQPLWLGSQNLHPAAFGCDWNLTDDMKQDMKVPANVLMQYFDQKLAPKSMKGQLSKQRSTTMTDIMPVLMASYGSQHRINPSLLKKKGLYGHFLAEPSQDNPACKFLRWWHPIELGLMFGPFNMLFLRKPKNIAYLHLGNAITTVHAIFAISTIVPLVFEEAPIHSSRSNLLEFLTTRMTKTNSKFLDHDKCWIVAKSELMEQAEEIAKFFYGIIHREAGSLPHGTFFHPDKGICSISDFMQEGLRRWVKAIDIPASPTFKNWGWKQLLVEILGERFVGANIQSDVLIVDLFHFWGDRADLEIIDTTNDENLHPQMLKLGLPSRYDHQQDVHCVIAFVKNQAWIANYGNETPIKSLIEEFQCSSMYDDIGKLHDEMAIRHDIVLFDSQPPTMQFTGDIVAVGRAMCNCKILFKHDCKKDELVVSVINEGCDERDWHQMTVFWAQHAQQPWWKGVGREIVMEHLPSNTKMELRLYATKTMLAVPSPDAMIVLLTQGIRSFLQHISDSSHKGVSLRLKWRKALVWTGILPETLSVSFLRGVFQFFFQSWISPHPMSFIAYGKRVGDEITFQQLELARTSNKAILIVAQDGFAGGGGTKKDLDIDVRNRIASALLPHGVQVSVLPQMTEAILKHFGRSRLVQIFKSTSEDQLDAEIVRLASQAGYHIKTSSNAGPKFSNAGKRVKTEDHRHELMQMDLEGVQLEPGFLTSGNGTIINQIGALVPKKTGVVLVKEQHIYSWLSEGQTISPDPLAAFVVGKLSQGTSLDVTDLCLPARDAQGRPILLSGQLVQFGQSLVKYVHKNDEKVLDIHTKIVAITAWKDEIQNDQWDSIIRSPFKALLGMIHEHEATTEFHASWGTSFHKQGQAVGKHEAESIQLHATIDERFLPALLRLSGMMGLYINPKPKQDDNIEEWKIIWLPIQVKASGSIEEAMRLLSKIDEPYGLVRSKTNFGIRVKQSDFERFFKVIKPNEPIPNSIHGKMMFKITPLPFGCTPIVIQEWLSVIKWEATVVRSLGPQTWLLAADSQPESAFLTFNGTTLLVRQIPGKQEKPKSAIIAGPRLPKLADPKGKDQLQMKDPWAGYIPTGQSQHISVATSSSSQGAPTSGVMQTKLQQQDDKIAAMCEEVQKLKVSQQKMAENMNQKVADVTKTVENQKTEFSNQLQQVKLDLENSFQKAIQSQNNNIASGFQDIKNMFQQSQTNKGVRRSLEQMEAEEDQHM